jgi:hypothetical protein
MIVNVAALCHKYGLRSALQPTADRLFLSKAKAATASAFNMPVSWLLVFVRLDMTIFLQPFPGS